MKLMQKKYREAMEAQGLTRQRLEEITGLLPRAISWMLDGNPATPHALELLADAAALPLSSITTLEETAEGENMIEFLKDQERATLTLCQGRYKSRIRELATARPDECRLLYENGDGSIVAQIPTDWIRINPSMQLSEDQRQALAKRARNNLHADKRQPQSGNFAFEMG